MIIIFGTIVFYGLMIIEIAQFIITEYSESKRSKENKENKRQFREMIDLVLYLNNEEGWSKDEINNLLDSYGYGNNMLFSDYKDYKDNKE